MKKAQFLNNPTILNIFTDASLYKGSNTTIACAGAIAVTAYNDIVDSSYLLLGDSTNNQGEISAIKLGVGLAARVPRDQYQNINIISDSIISVRGLAEWLIVWYKNRKDNTLMSSSGRPVANQEVFIEIVNEIISLGINHLSIYHTLGHMRYTHQGDLQQVIRNFNVVNNHDISMEDARYLAYFNDVIDIETGERLETARNNAKQILFRTHKGLIPEFPTENDISRYFSIIGRNSK